MKNKELRIIQNKIDLEWRKTCTTYSEASNRADRISRLEKQKEKFYDR